MTTFVYVYTGYADYSDRMQPENYKQFKSVMKKQMEDGVLLQIDGECNPLHIELIDKVFDKMKEKYKIKLNVDVPLFNLKNHTLEDLIALCRDLDYCHIWHDDPIEFVNTYKLSDGNQLLYLKLEAESG